ncbi:cystathionine beta-lyase [Shewanella sp. 1_MG-2023]|uniref:cystathionine beta-lyase n=1 Tax=unclassified Shewanella TaxID=196818 RepID=UPI000C83E801|nr:MULTISPECIES: cystathionine beta-lyase [unclassified Shewanella]MDO6611885.1 cystathionine beta-lyase [Shewanella sp. 7_MG-2023]MDO6771740.1 cystathionine beta-lyase [Shewanella sp. 2_MG-2023]MDO6793966.1 cystathionine beta-lyase [Shewanella sp. 1_MG-2023]PMG74546.1 cystathionine beta-lyase [Shewanella sp. 10N.286.51.B7]
MSNQQDKLATQIVSVGREKKYSKGIINPPVYRASTVVFDTMDDMRFAIKNKTNGEMFYGRRGTPTHFSFQQAISELEGGAGTALYPSGAGAISAALLSFLKSGDHLLMVDSAYEPTRDLCNKLLAGFGIETTYYDPLIGEGIKDLIQPNTKVLFLESPGSITMEIQDVPTLSRIAHEHDVVVMLDNTWASPINSRPFEMGVDISIQAATKYIVGHSDVMMGTATANEAHWEQLRENSYIMGQTTSPDDVYLAARGLRTLGVRMAQHDKNALKVANWLASRPEVDHLRHPAFETCPGHEFYQRDFSGGNGLFSFVLKQGNLASVTAFVENMRHFKMGFSWGGYESLILGVFGIDRLRTATTWDTSKPLIRLHIGLEDPDDLIADLTEAFERFNAVIDK